MNWDSLIGVGVGSVLTYLGQWATERRTTKRDAARVAAEASVRQRAEWKALQVETLVDLQEQIELVTVAITADISLRKLEKRSHEQLKAALEPVGRVVLLCSRMEDRPLATDVEVWLKDMRDAASTADHESLRGELRDRRTALQARLGSLLHAYHAG